MEALECHQYNSVQKSFELHQQLEDYADKLPTTIEQHDQQLQQELVEQNHQQQQQQYKEKKLSTTTKATTSLTLLTPNKVGHEFVKQYYRILYKAPEVLHRFYTNDSTCTRHDFNMVIGKREIQHLFQRENYRKCRTNIFNTDIHGTIANGVVVLVTGEQSNFGSPMRSFVQTFVLAAEGPRKYYISNDIFRYANVFAKSISSMLVDVACQTSSLHLGDGDRESSAASSSNEHVVELGINSSGGVCGSNGGGGGSVGVGVVVGGVCPQQLSSKAPVYDFYKSSNVGLGCPIPMPRWASSRPSRDSSVGGSFTHTYTQQETLTIQAVDADGNVVDENLPLSDYNTSQEQEQQQAINEYPFYRSIIAQALSPRMEFAEITPTSNQYVNAIYYNEDVSRASVGVSSVRVPKRRGGDSQQQQQQQLYARANNEDQINAAMAPNDQQQQQQQQETQPPTYAKLFMNALTRAGMKNNTNSMTSSSSSPMKGSNIVPSIYNAPPRSNNESTNNPTIIGKSTNQQQHGSMHHGVHHQQHQHHADVGGPQHNTNYAPMVHSQDYTPVQRNNNNNNNQNNYSSGGMRRNERRRSNSAQKYNDNQQLFLGQIPHNATEEELIRIFSCFGNVLELRILPNLNGKIQPGAKHPLKYGFLTFEHVESVKACLESRPVYFPNNSPDGQKLNVRAKKPAVSRDDQSGSMPPNCQQQLDSQSLTSEWPQTRRNNSISSSSTIGSSAGGGSVGVGGASLNNVFNRKDNRNGRAASLDSSAITTTTSNSPNGGGGRKFTQMASGAGGGGVVNNCGGRR